MEKPHNRDKCAKCAAKAVWVGYCRTCAREILHALGECEETRLREGLI